MPSHVEVGTLKRGLRQIIVNIRSFRQNILPTEYLLPSYIIIYAILIFA